MGEYYQMSSTPNSREKTGTAVTSSERFKKEESSPVNKIQHYGLRNSVAE
jgi:hypothetical protein